jgi:hypothetical protein
METESWKPITGFEGIYEISNWGNVRSLDRYQPPRGKRHGRWLRGQRLKPTNSEGYPAVTLYPTKIRIHTLVANHFLDPKPDWANQPNHIDGNKTNNYFKNLEWSNDSLNNQHAYRIGLQPKRKLTDDQVREIKAELAKPFISTDPRPNYGRYAPIARKHGISVTLILAIIKGTCWEHIK